MTATNYPRNITLLSEADVEIPPNHIGIARCMLNDNNYIGDAFIDLRHSYEPMRECIVPRCVTSTAAARVSVLNVSGHSLHFAKGQLMARGCTCIQDGETRVSVHKVDLIKLPKFSMLDLHGHMPNDISESDAYKLLLLLNKYRYCFAQNIDELDYLGYAISAEGIRPGTVKTKAVEEFPTPKSIHQVRPFVGLCSYFRKYVKCLLNLHDH
ncbi:hypothetical protein NQ317_001153 [Molorchus minor]|uniref:Uncharacterized protein n=1 Tax=Molorchus minor TaxID=1323400 RepID=A0ABQ9JFK5_9CUCU|nr:hypothetical protein NQ317_001153 [Molorchus minor]